MEGHVFSLLFLSTFFALQDSSLAAINKEGFLKENLLCHNKYRALHQASKLDYSPIIQKAAQRYADQLASQDMGLVHDRNSKYGENLFYAFGKEVKGNDACQMWYNENKKYTYGQKSPINFSQVGHFTQLVWKGSKTMGVGVAVAKSGSTYVVTKYDPPGNMLGDFNTNVLPPK